MLREHEEPAALVDPDHLDHLDPGVEQPVEQDPRLVVRDLDVVGVDQHRRALDAVGADRSRQEVGHRDLVGGAVRKVDPGVERLPRPAEGQQDDGVARVEPEDDGDDRDEVRGAAGDDSWRWSQEVRES